MKRAKKAPAAPDAAPIAVPPAKTAIKVLKGGKSWHVQGQPGYVYPLPTQGVDGVWTPGEWTPAVVPVWCSAGYHLTTEPARWWGDGDVVAYLAEYDGAEARREGEEKFAVERCRLLRPLTEQELHAAGIYLTGRHKPLGQGAHWIGGTAHVDGIGDSAHVVWIGDSAHVVRIGDSAHVDWIGDSAHVDWIGDSAHVDGIGDSAHVDGIGDSAHVVRIGDSAHVDGIGDSATAHATDEAVLVVRYGRPTVTLRRNASLLDYRQRRPVHRLADEGQVLTLAPDGTTSQAPVST